MYPLGFTKIMVEESFFFSLPGFELGPSLIANIRVVFTG
jgi:hypothetical protein